MNNELILQTLYDGWKIVFDEANAGQTEKWYETGVPEKDALNAVVPSYVHLYFPNKYGVAWYQHEFTALIKADENHLCFLRAEKSSFLCDFYLNGIHVGHHRGTEESYSFDITDAVKTEGKNLLVARTAKPHGEPIDGYSIQEIPHSNQQPQGIIPGTQLNFFGLPGKVDLVILPKVRMEDVYLHGNIKTGSIDAQITVRNHFAEPVGCTLVIHCGDKRSGELRHTTEHKFTAQSGESIIKLSAVIHELRLWSPADPFLYFVDITLTSVAGLSHKLIKNCGFREFYVGQDGYFYLNGKRIFFKCSHTGNAYLQGNNIAVEPEMWRRDFFMAKAAGLNALRYMGVITPEQLDYCDEIGLMIYEETHAGWLMEIREKANYERGREMYETDVLSMVRRDRSHPCVTIWGMLNETPAAFPFGDFAVFGREILEKVRELDETRLVLYNSGRWDGDLNVGSLSNPYSHKWQCLWNEEDERRTDKAVSDGYPGAWQNGMGDMHCYPRLPISKRDISIMRAVGSVSKRPCFISEFGIGSIYNTSWVCRSAEQRNYNPEVPDVAMTIAMDKRLRRTLEQYGFDDVFAFPIDIMRESERLHSRQRQICFNIVRSNPYINGYSITGLIDHSICGEGLMSIFREWKPGIADVLQGGLAPLRWCLFVDDKHVYRNRLFTIEGVIANEDVLKTGDYPLKICITGDQGIVYAKKMTLSVTEENLSGFSIPVFKEQITLDVPSGVYQLHAEFLEGAAAFDSVSTFFITDGAEIAPETVRAVVIWGVSCEVSALLKEKGIKTIELAEADESIKNVVLIGDAAEESKETGWLKINSMLKNGSRVFVGSRFAMVKDDCQTYYLPVAEKPDTYPHGKHPTDWLYHKEYIIKRHDYFRGLPVNRVMDWEYYMYIISGQYFFEGQTPDETQAIAAGTGNINPIGYEGGFTIGTYNVYRGAITVNSLNILENIGRNPAADRLLINILDSETKRL